MDYSLLVGIHNMERGNRDELRNRGLTVVEVRVPVTGPVAREKGRWPRDQSVILVCALCSTTTCSLVCVWPAPAKNTGECGDQRCRHKEPAQGHSQGDLAIGPGGLAGRAPGPARSIARRVRPPLSPLPSIRLAPGTPTCRQVPLTCVFATVLTWTQAHGLCVLRRRRRLPRHGRARPAAARGVPHGRHRHPHAVQHQETHRARLQEPHTRQRTSAPPSAR